MESLEEYGGDHPLTAELAVATAKRYLAEDRHRIRLEDLVKRETERLYEGLFLADSFPAGEATSITETGFRSRVESYGRLTEVLLAVMIVGCYWDEKQRGQLWASCLERIANPPAVGGALPYVELRRYPALLLMYGGGIASITGDRYETLTTLLYRARVRRQSEEYPLTLALNTRSFPSGLGWMNSYLQLDRSPDQRVNFFRPFSENLYQALRGPLHEMLPDEANYQKYFDRFEYLLGLVYVDQRKEHMPDYSGREGYGPIGLFGYRRQQPEGHRVLEEIASEAESLREEWPPLRAGLFGYSYERYRVAKDAFNAFVEEETSGW